jgi:hypothetical protein
MLPDKSFFCLIREFVFTKTLYFLKKQIYGKLIFFGKDICFNQKYFFPEKFVFFILLSQKHVFMRLEITLSIKHSI